MPVLRREWVRRAPEESPAHSEHSSEFLAALLPKDGASHGHHSAWKMIFALLGRSVHDPMKYELLFNTVIFNCNVLRVVAQILKLFDGQPQETSKYRKPLLGVGICVLARAAPRFPAPSCSPCLWQQGGQCATR